MAKKVVRKWLDGLSAKGELMWKLEGHRLVIGGNGRMRDFTDTEQAPWLLLAEQIQSVVVEDGVENIGGRAFQGFTQLQSVHLAATVIRIGWQAFYGCSSLKTVTGQRPLRHWRLPASQDVTFVGHQAFRGTQVPQEELVIHDGVVLEYTGTNPVVVIPEGIQKIAPYAFAQIPLESVEFPQTLERVEHGAFYATGLTSVVLPSKTLQVDAFAFAGNPELAQVFLGNVSVELDSTSFKGTPVYATKRIGRWLLSHDMMHRPFPEAENGKWSASELSGALKEPQTFHDTLVPQTELMMHDGIVLRYTGTNPVVVIPEGIREIAPYAFAHVPLESVTFPRTLERVHHGAFYATGLKRVILPAKMQQIGAFAFAENPELAQVFLGKASVQLTPTSFKGTPVYATKRIGRWFLSRAETNLSLLEVDNGKWSVTELMGVLRGGGVILLAEKARDGSTTVQSCFLDFEGSPMAYWLSPYLAEDGILGEQEVVCQDISVFRQRYSDPDTWLSIQSEATDYWDKDTLVSELRYWKSCVRKYGEALFISWDRYNFRGPLELALCERLLDEHPNAFVGTLKSIENAS